MNETLNKKNKVILTILDGFAFGNEKNQSNPVNIAKIETIRYLKEKYINYELFTSGKEIGLSEGQIGNSEVGHLTIGAGKIILQSLERINDAFAGGSIVNNKSIKGVKKYLNQTKKENKNISIHLVGLFSKGGVHSFYLHFLKLIEVYKDFSNVCFKLHLWTDGRDCGEKDFAELLDALNDFVIKNSLNVEICTISGRYYAMDRDKRHERTLLAYLSLMRRSNSFLQEKIEQKEIFEFTNPKDYIINSYSNGITDEFIKPARNKAFEGFKEEDVTFFVNFRADRMRQIISFLCNDSLSSVKLADTEFLLKEKLKCKKTIAFMDYFADQKILKNMNIEVVFTKEKIKNTISEILSKNNKTQVKITETEKYAHLTFFFNGEREKPFKGERRTLVASPNVERYNSSPEMSVVKIGESVLSEIDVNTDFICINIANCDMIGHTADFQACISALESVDKEIAKIYNKAKKFGYTMLITADHGNIEDIGHEGKRNTAHTLNKVPLIIVSDKYEAKNLEQLRKDDATISFLENNKNHLTLADIKKVVCDLILV